MNNILDDKFSSSKTTNLSELDFYSCALLSPGVFRASYNNYTVGSNYDQCNGL